MSFSDRIPVTVLAKASATERHRRETDDHHVRRLTHLNLQRHKLHSLAGVEICENLRVLFAFENHIRSLPAVNLASLANLTHLELMRNDLETMDGFEALVNLEKLHLDDNRLHRIHGLENCRRLLELTVSRQRGDEVDEETGEALPPSGGLVFDEETVMAIGPTLRLLDASRTGLQSLSGLGPLVAVEKVVLCDNPLERVSEAAPIVSGWRSLTSLDVRRTPMGADRRTVNALVAVAGDGVREVNGREVTAKQREFLVRLELRRRGLLRQPPKEPTKEEQMAANVRERVSARHRQGPPVPTAGGFGSFAREELRHIRQKQARKTRKAGAHAVADAIGFGSSSHSSLGPLPPADSDAAPSIGPSSVYRAPGGRPMPFEGPTQAAPPIRGERGITPGEDWKRPPPATPWGKHRP